MTWKCPWCGHETIWWRGACTLCGVPLRGELRSKDWLRERAMALLPERARLEAAERERRVIYRDGT